MKKLNELIDSNSNITIEYLSENNQDIQPNTMFFALKGASFDAHNVIDEVIEKGAVAIVHTDDLKSHQEGIEYFKVKDINETMAEVANKFYDFPSTKAKVMGVTGTNGKTTIAWLMNQIFKKHSTSGYIGTIDIEYADKVLTNHFTTPKPIELNSVLNDMIDHNVKYINLEVSSHALETKRVYDIDFDYAVMTNLTSDHENFHGGMQNYSNAKRILFEDLKEDAIALLNIDDNTFEDYKAHTKAKVYSYGIEKEADIQASNVVIKADGTEFDLKILDQHYHVETNLIALFNVYNLMPVLAIAYFEGLDMNEVLEQAKHLEFARGRMKIIKLGQDFDVIVDYAHTPDGFIKVMEFAKKVAKGDIISVFGSAGGDRNREKRPVIGEIASRYSDIIVLTQDDNRDENVFDINREIAQGIKGDVKVIEYEKRKDAVENTVRNAKKDDMILLLSNANVKYNVVANNQDEPYEGDIDISERVIRERLGLSNEIK